MLHNIRDARYAGGIVFEQLVDRTGPGGHAAAPDPDRSQRGVAVDPDLVLSFPVESGREAAFEAIAQGLRASTVREPGCRHYEYWRSATPRNE